MVINQQEFEIADRGQRLPAALDEPCLVGGIHSFLQLHQTVFDRIEQLFSLRAIGVGNGIENVVATRVQQRFAAADGACESAPALGP